MTNPAARGIHGDRDQMTTPTRTVEDLDLDIGALIASAEPAVVFSSLARLCVPTFSDTCTVDIVEHESAAYRITYPLTPIAAKTSPKTGYLAEHRPDTWHRVSTRFDSIPDDTMPAYFGVVTHTWRDHGVTAADAAHAQLLTDRAVAAITGERRADTAQHPACTAHQPAPRLVRRPAPPQSRRCPGRRA